MCAVVLSAVASTIGALMVFPRSSSLNFGAQLSKAPYLSGVGQVLAVGCLDLS